MSTTLTAPEQRVRLNNISWATYQDLLRAHTDASVPRFTYDRGELEISSPSPEHEYLKDVTALLVSIIAEPLEIDAEGFGSTTFHREDILRGFEPDACFYIANLDRVKGKTKLDFNQDPPPDLVIEIDITHPSLPRFPILAEFGVPEVWRHDGEQLQIFCLEAGAYVQRDRSAALRGVTAETLTELIGESRHLPRREWLCRIRERARAV